MERVRKEKRRREERSEEESFPERFQRLPHKPHVLWDLVGRGRPLPLLAKKWAIPGSQGLIPAQQGREWTWQRVHPVRVATQLQQDAQLKTDRRRPLLAPCAED